MTEPPLPARDPPTGLRDAIKIYRVNLLVLRLYEGHLAVVWVALSLMIVLGIPLLPIAALTASVYNTGDRAAGVGVGLLLIVATVVAGTIWRRYLWVSPVRFRILRWELADDARTVTVCVCVCE